MERNTLAIMDVLDFAAQLAPASVHCLCTSPPYWNLRDYGQPGQLGLERTPEEYVERMVAVFRALRPGLHESGVLFLNLGDSYNAYNGNRGTESQYAGKRNEREPAFPAGHGLMAPGLKQKDLVGIPWMVAFALRADGWTLRADIIWSKPNPMPESVTDRPTKSHEYVFLLSKGPRYFFDADAIREPLLTESNYREKAAETWGREARLTPNGAGEHEWNNPAGRNARSVWTIATAPFPGSHFATFPPELARRCIRAGTSAYGVCANPACGAPWRRVVESSNPSKAANEGEDLSGGAFVGRTANPQTSKGLHRNGGGVYSSRQVLGWEPICTCNADVVPAVVADPFAGSCTTLATAVEEGRDYLGCDLDERARGWLAGRLAKVQRRLPLDIVAD